MASPGTTFSVGSAAPSLLYNNLCCPDAESLFLASGTGIVQISTSTRDVLQIAAFTDKIVHLASCTAYPPLSAQLQRFVLAATVGGQTELLADGISVGALKYPETTGKGTCAAVTIATSVDARHKPCVLLMCGTSQGVVIISEYNGTASGVALAPISSVNVHAPNAVTALDVSGSSSAAFAVSGDSNGGVAIWDQSRTPRSVLTTNTDEKNCVTAAKIVACGTLAAVAYGNGKLIVYDTTTTNRLVEVCAHSRWINALAYCPERHLLATAAEDEVVQVWIAPQGVTQCRMQLVASYEVKNALPTGVAFSGQGRMVSVAAYDDSLVRSYPIA